MVAEATGRIAISRAGNDRGRYYLIIGVNGGRAQVVDGHRKTFAKPGTKNLRHLSVTKTALKGWERLAQGESVGSNLKLVGLLRKIGR